MLACQAKGKTLGALEWCACMRRSQYASHFQAAGRGREGGSQAACMCLPACGTPAFPPANQTPTPFPCTAQRTLSAFLTTPTPPSGLMARFSAASVCRPTITYGQGGRRAWKVSN